MLQPKKTKYTKGMKGRVRGYATSNNKVDFGEFGLKSVESGWIKANEIEAARKAITGHIKRKGKVWIKVFPHKPLTKKPNNVKMIGGKGAVEGYVVTIKPGNVMFELSGVDEAIAREAMRLGAQKLSVMTKFVKREEF